MRRLSIYGAVAIACLAGAAAAYAVWGRGDAEQRYRLGRADRGQLIAATSASGTLNPVTTVQVGSQVSGQIREILVDFNSRVAKGDLIARIDPDTFETRVAQAEADLEVARASVMIQEASALRMQADLESARASLLAARAQTSKAEIAIADAQREMERKKALADRGFGAMSERDRTQATFDQARAQARTAQAQEQGQGAAIRSAEAQVKAAQAQLANAEALVRVREAALRQARVDLERTFIRAPVSGTVILRNVDAGQTVAASLQAPVLFTIAQDLREMQVETSVDEADIGRIREGQRTTFTVDAFPGRSFRGEVRQIRKAPQIVQNVVTYTVVVSADNSDLALLPGMTANVRIVTDQREAALRVPNAALRFRPPGFVEAGQGVATAGQPPASSAPAATTAPAAGGGPQQLQQFRARLIDELKLDDGQVAQLDAILQGARQRGAANMGDATLSDGERRQRIERNRSEVRQKISEILNPEQRALYERMQAEQAGRAAGGAVSTPGRVFLLGPDGQPKPVQLRLGLTDGNFTEILQGEISEGAEVILGTIAPATKPGAPATTSTSPRFRL